LLKNGNFEEPAVVIKKLKEKQLLDHDSDRNTRTCKIVPGGLSLNVYALRVLENPDCENVKDEQEERMERDANRLARTQVVNKTPPSKKVTRKTAATKNTSKYYLVNYNGNWYSIFAEHVRLNMTVAPLGENFLVVCHNEVPTVFLDGSNVSKLLRTDKEIKNNCLIHYNDWWYTVPSKYAGLDLTIEPNGNSLVLYHDGEPVEVYQVKSSSAQTVKDDKDYLDILNDED